MGRFATHTLALAGVVLLVLASVVVGTRPGLLALGASAAAPDGTASGSTSTVLEPAMRALGLSATAVPANAGSAPPAPAASPTPANRLALDALPAWVATTAPVALWTGSASGSSVSMQVPSGTSLKTLGTVQAGRLLVYFPGDSAGNGAAQAWVDVASVQASVIPPWLGTTPPGQLPPGTTLPNPPTLTGSDPAPQVTAAHVAIVDEASGKMIYSLAPTDEVPEASVTKIATAIVALERAPDMQKRVTVTVDSGAMVAQDGSSVMGLELGDSVTLETLMYGMLLPSGNDAAEQIALSLGGTRDTYIGWMNDEAQALGLRDTHFVNPSGMDAEGHYSSALDMALLARYAMRNSYFRQLVSTQRMESDDYIMHNLNRLLGVYPGADGVKIGETDAALKTFVASDTRDGHRVYVSLMHSQDIVDDSEALFDWVWSNYTWQQ